MTLSGVDGTPLPYRAAAIQFEPTLFGKSANMEALLRLTEEAAAGGAKLIVTPEMATTAYCWATRDEIASDVEPVPGPTTRRFAEIAAEHDCWIVVGLAEVDPETGDLLQQRGPHRPEGPVGLYRKTHAYISEPKWAKDGDLGLPVFETPHRPHRHDDLHGRLLPRDGACPGAGGRGCHLLPHQLAHARRAPRQAGWRAPPRTASTSSPPTAMGWSEACSSPAGSAVIDPDGSLAECHRYAAMASSGAGSIRLVPGTSGPSLAAAKISSPTAARTPTAR